MRPASVKTHLLLKPSVLFPGFEMAMAPLYAMKLMHAEGEPRETRRENVGFTGSGRPLRFELWGARGDRALYLSVSQGSKLLQEQHKRHKVYTSLGHHCGVIAYSSVVGGLPLGLMRKNNTRKNNLARVCSWLGDELLGGVRSPFSLSL